MNWKIVKVNITKKECDDFEKLQYQCDDYEKHLRIGKYRFLLYHYINGIWSGIPHCCVVYFCKRYFQNPFRPISLETKMKRGYEIKKLGYVACDKCFQHRNFVKIKSNDVIFKSLIGKCKCTPKKII